METETKQRPKLLDRVRQTFIENNYSQVTSNLYIKWIKRYIIFHKKVHPSYLNEKHIAQFLNYLSGTLNLSHSTQRQAFAAINFLYTQVLTDGWIMRDNFVWVNKNKQKPKKVTEKILTKSDKSRLNVFLCYANEDKKTIRKLYKRLKKWQAIESYKKDGYSRLKKALNRRALTVLN